MKTTLPEPEIVTREGNCRIRVGDYRVVYDIADEIRVVRVNRVRRCREVCR